MNSKGDGVQEHQHSYKTEDIAMASPMSYGERAREEGVDEEGDVYKSTYDDAQAMRRMGRRQELVRHYRVFSMVSFVGMATAAWEVTLYQITPALRDGGLPALVYSNIWIFCAFVPVALSLAEMSSMAPIAGAQYHWVSEFAPERYQKFLSYLTGWTSTLALQAGNASGLFLIGTLVQAIIQIHQPGYQFENWHGTLLAVGVCALAVVANVHGSRVLPYWQNPVFAINILAYFAFLVPVWCNAPRTTSEHVWTRWENAGGWPSLTIAVLVGQLPAITSQTGIDAAVHMAEEVRNASSSVPRVVLSVFGINFFLNIATVVTLCYHMPDVSVALAEPTMYPAIWVLRQSMSDTWLTVLLVVQCIFLLFSNFSYLAAVSRDLFAFARDKGLPCSAWLAKVDKERKIPVNAYYLTGIFAALLSLLYLGSPVALYAIGSLLACAIMQCYCFSISCVLWRRIYHPETLPHAPFSLGRLGVPINVVAVLVVVWSFFWAFWPQEYPVTPSGFNWSVAIFVPTVAVALVYYVVKGRYEYEGPVVLVEGRKKHLA
ncbi:GABA permease [Cordyceps militaris]|uniref:GABA permease n=1 Tax=Cordyceps militaris TaxID=73501 RepID=A0A2H4SM98_CORMI|nr:GABA permease [Cordyceps militaris]